MNPQELYEQTGQMAYKSEPQSLKYMLSFAELVDRLNIVSSKSVFLDGGAEKFEGEMRDIVHDIQWHINNGVQITGEVVRAIILLTQSNLALWINEDAARLDTNSTDYEATAKTLQYTHKLNGTRSQCKTRIQNLIGGRTDEKINCLAENSAWQIKW